MVKKLANANRIPRDRTTYTRPEGAGNFDNMDDKNIVDQINIKIGTSDLTPTLDKHIANKKYVDDTSAVAGNDTEIQYNNSGSHGADSGFTWDGDTLTIEPADTAVGTIGLNVSDEFLIKKVSATGYRIQGRGFSTIAASDYGGFTLLTSGNAAQSMHCKGIRMGSAFSSVANAGEIRTQPGVTMKLEPEQMENHILINTTGAIFNNPAVDEWDFQIKGNVDENLFYLKGTDDKIGIGTNTPDEILQVAGNIHIDDDSTVDGVRNQKYYAEGYVNSQTTVQISTQNVWHPAIGLSQGEVSDFVFDAGGVATVTVITDAGEGDVVVTTSAAHGFSEGDPVYLVGGTGYDGVYIIKNVGAAAEFDITAPFVATGTGTAIVGDNVTVPVDGVYIINAGLSGQGLTGAATYEFDTFIDATRLDKGAASRKFANTTDRGNMSNSYFLDLTAGEKLTMSVRNITNTNNFDIYGANFNIHRIV